MYKEKDLINKLIMINVAKMSTNGPKLLLRMGTRIYIQMCVLQFLTGSISRNVLATVAV